MSKKNVKSNFENWPRKKVNVADLFLDPENIRLGVEVQTSQQEAVINDLFANENAMQVLESIAKNGFFPDEIPVVIKEDSKIVVIEGNRRIAALKALARPEIVASKEDKIKQILKTAPSVLKSLDVIVAPDRDSVRNFLANKHTQNTRRAWRPLRQAYFYKAELARGKTVKELRDDYPTVDIGKFLRMINVHRIAKSIKYDSDLISKKVFNERTFPASTLERLYDDKNIRQFLGFDFDGDGEVNIKIKKEEFEKGFKRVVQDVVDKVVDSRALNNEKNRKEYIASFSKSDTPNKKPVEKKITSKSFTEISPLATKKRLKLAPRDIRFSLQSTGVRRMLIELQNIDYHKFPNASHDLLRSFLECALKAYFDQAGNKVAPLNGKPYVYLDDVLKQFKDEMDSDKNTELSQVTQKIITDTKMKSYSAQFLNATNHNPSIFATPTEVEDAWDTMDKLFRHILNPVKKKNDKNKS